MKNAPEHMRYLGVVSLLAKCAAHVPEDLRDSIDWALSEAVEENSGLTVHRFLNGRDVSFELPKAPAALD